MYTTTKIDTSDLLQQTINSHLINRMSQILLMSGSSFLGKQVSKIINQIALRKQGLIGVFPCNLLPPSQARIRLKMTEIKQSISAWSQAKSIAIQSWPFEDSTTLKVIILLEQKIINIFVNNLILIHVNSFILL